MTAKRIVIIGAGPTGLGAAYRLHELGHDNWSIHEREEYVGGLSSSFIDEKGFTWDIGGHVMFSGNERFNALAGRIMGPDFISHERNCWIRTADRWVPYPFQNNIRHLAKESTLECLVGLLRAREAAGGIKNFNDWIYKAFGEGIARHFMVPYNTKVWATPLELMSYDWIAERVSVIDIERIMKNVVLGQDEAGWGPNSRFKFPLHGGTGGFFNRFEPFLKGRISHKSALAAVDMDSKTLTFADGEHEGYDVLINTSPLDRFVRMLKSSTADISVLEKAAGGLKHNSIFVVGIGLKKKMEGEKCWVYFPDGDIPFYRMTYFSRYSPNNVPGGDTSTYSSLMCEVSFSQYRDVREDEVVEACIRGLVRAGILTEADTDTVISRWLKRIDYAYPVPTIERDASLREIQQFLESRDIYSRGRFGAWKYEIGNMDHSVLMGIEAVDRIISGEKENVWLP